MGTGLRNPKNIVLPGSCAINCSKYCIPVTVFSDVFITEWEQFNLFHTERAGGTLSGLKIWCPLPQTTDLNFLQLAALTFLFSKRK